MSDTTDIVIGDLRKQQFDYAKRWMTISNVSRFAVFAVSIYLIFFDEYSSALAIAAALLAICDIVSQWRSDILRDIAEKMLNMNDLNDGLGWPITDREKRDWLARLHNVNNVQVRQLVQGKS